MAEASQVRSALEEMQGLIHEAMSNVELDRVQGHALIEQIQGVLGQIDGTVMPTDALESLLGIVHSAVAGPSDREREKDNPIAAVHRVEEIIGELRGTL